MVQAMKLTAGLSLANALDHLAKEQRRQSTLPASTTARNSTPYQKSASWAAGDTLPAATSELPPPPHDARGAPPHVVWAPELEQRGGVFTWNAAKQPTKPILKVRSVSFGNVQNDLWSSHTEHGGADAFGQEQLAEAPVPQKMLRIKLVKSKKRSREAAWEF